MIGECWNTFGDLGASTRSSDRKYEHIFSARFPGSSRVWVRALTEPGAPMPAQLGYVWCDLGGTRLFAHRRHATSR